jgi:hypothetical protein
MLQPAPLKIKATRASLDADTVDTSFSPDFEISAIEDDAGFARVEAAPNEEFFYAMMAELSIDSHIVK